MRRSRMRAAWAVAGAFAVAATLSACGGSDADDGGSTGASSTPASTTADGEPWGGGGGAVVANLPADWQTMDHQVYTPGLMWWETGGYDRLTAIHDGEVVPYLAESWEVADDNTSATFKLRTDAKCQDGTPITPKVVADSFERLFSVPKKGVPMVQDFGSGPWSASYDDKKGTVTIHTETPFRGLVAGVASPQAGIVCPAGLKNPKKLETQWFGSGPYKLVSAKHGDKVVMEKNTEWTWGPVIDGHQVTADDLPDQQTWNLIADPTAVANAMLTGELQVARLSGPDVKRIDGNDDFTVRTWPLNFPTTLVFQQGPGHATADPVLRKAISTAVDPMSLAKAYATEGLEPELVTSFVLPTSDCYNGATADLYPSGGVEAAKQVLTDAGYTGVGEKLIDPDGKPVTVRVVVPPALAGQSGQYLLQALKPLGIDVDLTEGDIATTTKLVYGGQADIAVTGGGSGSGELASTIISYFYGPTLADGGLNVYGPPPEGQDSDPEWNELMAEAVGSSDCGPWEEAQAYALEKGIFLPVAQGVWYAGHANDVKVSNGYFMFEPWTIRNAD